MDKETKTGLTKEQERCLMLDSPLNGRKETTDKIPTAEEMLSKYILKLNAEFTLGAKALILSAMKEYAKLHRDYHLTKQAEVIAEKVESDLENHETAYNTSVKSILQASEDYKQTIK